MRSRASRRAALRRGAMAEGFVAEALERQGWQVLARNWAAAGGELDLVVMRDGCLRFVEVRARGSNDPSALESIGPAKRRKLVRAAEAWLQRSPEYLEVAFMVASVGFERDGWTVELIDDAFDAG